MPVAVVLGARNLGGAVARHLADRDWAVAAVARSQATLDALPEAITGLTADATEPAELDRVLGEVAERLGGLDLVVNAVSASRPPAGGGAFGGGPVADLTPEAFHGWGGLVAEQAAVFLAAGTRALRALAHAAAQELREEGIHVALLIADGTIDSPKRGATPTPPEGLLDQDGLAAAVAYLAGQGPRGYTHELVLTPSGDRWTP